MTLTAAGRLLINTPTESTFHLDVNGAGRFTTSGNNIAVFNSTNADGGYITFRRSGNDFLYIGNSSAVGGGANNTDFYTAAGLGMRFFPNATGDPIRFLTTGAVTFPSSVTATSATLSGPLNINGSYIRGKTVTGTANGTDVILGVFLGYPGGISGTVEVFAMAGIILGGSISSRILTFNFSGGNQSGGGGANANVSNSVLGSVASGFAGSTNIDSLSASITSLTVDSFNISISNTITGTQITAPTYYIQVTYGLHGNASIS
jgi:hypothetical protein